MANTLSYYDEVKYAQEALLRLENTLLMGNRVHMGYDPKRTGLGKGSTIDIRGPMDFGDPTDAPATATAIVPKTTQLTLSFHKEQKVAITDKDIAFTPDAFQNDHMAAMIYSLANYIDKQLWDAMYKGTPWVISTTGTTMAVADVAAASRQLEKNGAPISDMANMFACIGPEEREALNQLSAFSQWQGAGDNGVNTQTTGMLGMKYGFNFASSQNRSTHSPGSATDVLGTLTTTLVAGATSIVLAALGADGTTYKAGDSFVVAGDTQRYVITATGTVSSAAVTLSFQPPVSAASAALYGAGGTGVVVTLDTEATKLKQNLFFNRNYCALGFGELPTHEEFGGLGARIGVATHPQTGLSVRSRVYYVGGSSQIERAFDVLFGIKVLNPNLAVRVRNA